MDYIMNKIPFLQSNRDDMELNDMETGSGSANHNTRPLSPSRRSTAYTHPFDSQDDMPVDDGPTFPFPFPISMPTQTAPSTEHAPSADSARAVLLPSPFTFGTSRLRTQNDDGPNKVRVVAQTSKLPHLVWIISSKIQNLIN